MGIFDKPYAPVFKNETMKTSVDNKIKTSEIPTRIGNLNDTDVTTGGSSIKYTRYAVTATDTKGKKLADIFWDETLDGTCPYPTDGIYNEDGFYYVKDSSNTYSTRMIRTLSSPSAIESVTMNSNDIRNTSDTKYSIPIMGSDSANNIYRYMVFEDVELDASDNPIPSTMHYKGIIVASDNVTYPVYGVHTDGLFYELLNDGPCQYQTNGATMYSNGINHIYPNSAPTIIYGVEWDKTNSSTKMTRTDASADYTFTPAVNSTGGSSSFDDQPIYKDIKLCNLLSDGTVIYQGESGFSYTPSTGDVMVEIPKFYYKIENTTSKLKLQISPIQYDGFLVSPRHASYGSISERDKIYIGAYTSNSSYRSISGNSSVVSITRSTARTNHKNRSTSNVKYFTEDYATYMTIVMLYMIEVADWNSQTAVGYGYANGNSYPTNTGGTNSISYHSGTVGSTLSTNGVVKYRHIENLWGNVYQWIDGINCSDSRVYVCINPDNYVDDVSTNYTSASNRSTSNGWITNLGNNTNNPWALIPTGVSGSSSTYIADYYNYSSGWQVLCVGGDWSYTTYAGLLYWDSDYPSSYTSTYIGCRVVALPLD